MTQDDKSKTGDWAFPKLKYSQTNIDGSTDHTIEGGMTLLDYVAAKAMPEILQQMRTVYCGNDSIVTEKNYNYVAELSYKLASAMIEERKKYLDLQNQTK